MNYERYLNVVVAGYFGSGRGSWTFPNIRAQGIFLDERFNYPETECCSQYHTLS